MARCDAIEECNRLLFEAVNESSKSKLQNVTSTHGEDIVLAGFDICNENGENPLVIALKGENVDLIVELVEFLQYCQNLYECYPVPLNAFDKLSNQIPIIQLIEHLFNKFFFGIDWLEFVAQVFIKSTSFTRQEKVIALELIGALLNMHLPFPAICAYPAHPSELGLNCWREAMALRYFPAEDEPLLPKTPDVSVTCVASSVVFGSAVEVMTMEQLHLLKEHFNRDFYSFVREVQLPCKKQMQRQALLVIRRITSQSNSEQPSSLYLESLHKFGSDLMYENQSNLGYSADNKLIINTHLLILEQMAGCDPIVLSRKSFDAFISTLHQMSRYFSRMLRQPSDSPGNREISYANLLPLTKFFGTIAKFFPEPAMMSSRIVNYPFERRCHIDFVESIFSFVFILESISPRLSSQEQQHLEEFYSYYIRNLFLDRTTTILHAAIRETVPQIMYGYKFRNFENLLPVVKLILKLGANPNAINKDGQTPLHILAGIEEIHLDENVALFQALVDAGTHLDIAADNGDTVLGILKKNLKGPNQSSLIVPPYYESLLNTVFPLSCYCARVIRRHGIRFDEDRLPIHLQTFVARHSAKEDPNDPTQADGHADN